MDVKKSPKRHKFPPVYEHSFRESRERGEYEQFRESFRLNIDCAKAITAALSGHYNAYSLDTETAAKEIVGKFGFDRTMYVLASAVRHYERDGRLSRSNKEWAHTIPNYEGNSYFTTGDLDLTDLFVDQIRHDYLLTQPLKVWDVTAEAEKILSQFQNLREPNSPGGEQFMVQVSPDFLERAKPKNMERLMALLPFPSLKISKSENRSETYAMIDKSENRWQPLQKRKPSIKARLAEKTVPGDKPYVKAKEYETR